jgi:hypothetical protein
MAGSLMAEHTYDKQNAHTDVDLFVPTSQVLISVGQLLLCEGFKFGERFDRVWERWQRYGFKSWHTNSLKLMSPGGVEYNLVYKLTDGHAATSLAEVLESFDFGLLGTGWDLESDQFRDMRGYLFPGLDPDGALPMMPNKRTNWRNGFISQYNGLREAGRYAKYHRYGYDLSLVKDDLVTGYWQASSYLATTFDADKQQLGKIYEVIAAHIEADHIDELLAASKKIEYKDALDVIMEALE